MKDKMKAAAIPLSTGDSLSLYIEKKHEGRQDHQKRKNLHIGYPTPIIKAILFEKLDLTLWHHYLFV